MLVAAAILVVTYVLVMADRFDRSIIALLGAGAMIASGVLSQDEAIRGVDFNTIALLTGMMILVAVARRSGIFEYLAIRSAKLARASPAGILAMLAVITAVISALLDNVTTVLLVAPVTLSITRRLGVAPFPFLFAEVLASNIGGTATLIGDPPNIMIGSAAGLSFNAFVLHLTPVIIVVLAVQTLAVHLVWGRAMGASATARAEVMALSAADAVTDWRLLKQSAAVSLLVLLAFVGSRYIGLEPGTISLVGAAALMLLDNLAHHRERQTEKMIANYADIDWITIFFFAGLFVVVHGLEATGMLSKIANALVQASGGNLTVAVFAVLWASAILSALIDNIPFVAAMIPLIKAIAPGLGGEAALMPLWWALSLGACLGGNGTLIGASANLTVAGIAQRNGIPFGFGTYTRFAAPMTFVSIVICMAYLWLRYL
ncbi:MAG TPA: ArsB/NhaD family transporter [Candidatus Cybelea sp.]|nr:ArsB/NhaD family transporter [Candidatus Cybelea sp.]